MNQDNKPKPAARDNGSAEDASGAGAKTPGTDMQPEDTGTADSGNTGRGSAVEGAMKQTSKTPAERGER
ncbi:MAG: hypothetical protein Q8R33_16140 [Burkholderiales bacterium]|nr:hypothetical protein [Burkholderiales bacterium]